MAGDYIIMRVDLCDDPDAVRISKLTGLDIDSVVGKLHRLWSWADRHTRNGFVTVDARWVDEFVRADGFVSALCAVGWASLSRDEERDGIWFLNFDRHNGHNAKSRADSRKRSAKYRENRVTDSSQDRHKKITRSSQKNVTTEEKRREEKSNTPTECSPPTPSAEKIDCPEPESGDDPGDLGPIPVPSPEKLQEVVDAWNSAGSVNPVKFLTEPRRRQLIARLRDKIFAEHWREAIQKISASEFFANGWKPGFAWFLDEENFLKVLEGNYDHKARAGPSRKSGGDEGKYGNEWLDELTEADLKQAEI